MTYKNCIVHGISCTTGEKICHECDGEFLDALNDLNDWLGWWNYFKDTRNLGGTEEDFYIECQVRLH